jgi:hypothetical protein
MSSVQIGGYNPSLVAVGSKLQWFNVTDQSRWMIKLNDLQYNYQSIYNNLDTANARFDILSEAIKVSQDIYDNITETLT